MQNLTYKLKCFKRNTLNLNQLKVDLLLEDADECRY